MKTSHFTGIALAAAGTFLLLAFTFSREEKQAYKSTYRSIPKGCVYRTLMGEESSLKHSSHFTPEKALQAIDGGLTWVAKAQHPSGGWGAGSHRRQDVMDPHQVKADPATTSMVAMAMLRSGHSLTKGEYSEALRRALSYLLTSVESSSAQSLTITDQIGTQIQVKLGSNIDVILTSQFFSNLLDGFLDHDPLLKERVMSANDRCIAKIQRAMDTNGSVQGSGWAGVLQSSFAANALEAAQAQGARVDDKVLQTAREFQQNNYDAKSGNVNTDLGAGVMLYAVTGSARASAKEARKVDEDMDRARRKGILSPTAAPSAANLEKIGYAKDEAIKHIAAYEIYQSAKVKAQQDEVMDGFGSNGGEEFLSYLQTGESMIIGKDNAWKKWYDNISGRLIKIQNDDGSWNGHHCITSPVFCTATCLLILSVNNDVDKLTIQGGK